MIELVNDRNLVNIDVKRLLEFFDEVPKGSAGHATSIVAVCGEDLGTGLLTHYFNKSGATVEVICPCTQGTLSGARLDCWIKVIEPHRTRLFQTEIKNWSAHAIGGKRLSIRSTPESVMKYKIDQWNKEWSDETGIKKPQLKKVLVAMRPPRHVSHIQTEPLACLWTAIHPTGDSECFFYKEISFPHWCERVWFFSMSAYLRSLNVSQIAIPMPNVVRRLKWLEEMLTFNETLKGMNG